MRPVRHARRRLLSFFGSFLIVAGLLPATAVPVLAAGSVSLTAIGIAYSENFDTLALSGTANTTLPTGWDLSESGTSTRNNAAYAASPGSDNAGDVYSFGASGVAERAYGTLLSGTLTPIVGASFTNNTSATITSLVVSYTGEEWRLGTADRVDRLDFQVSVDATGLASGTWTNHDALDFNTPNTTGPAGLRDGNAAANRSSIASSVTGLAIAPAATFWIRWTDFNASGADDGLAVDDFSLTPFDADGPPAVGTTTPASGATNVDPATVITINFNEPVNVTGSWFSISCTTSGPHTAAVTGGPAAYTLNPDADFATNESCSVTIVAAQVTDMDVNDPPDSMDADHTFSFTTLTACGDPATLIHAIQGSGQTSPMPNGSDVEVEGVVVGDFQPGTSFNGFHVQEEDGDADADQATSEGIFVFEGGSAVDVTTGDVVRVTGEVLEFVSSGITLTQVTNVTRVLVCSSGESVTPAEVVLPVPTIATLERYEGMLVFSDQDLTVTETFTLGRFGEAALSIGGRLANPTNVVDPGAPAIALQNLNNRSRILLDDGDSRQNIDPTLYPQGGLSASNTLRVGDTLDGGTFVLEQRFGVYRLQPIDAVEFQHDNLRPVTPEDVAGNLQVAAFNVLNYFTTLDPTPGAPGPFICGPTGGLECRGANTAFELQRQRDKIVSAMIALDADVLGLMELENNPSAAIQDLVNGLNAVAGPETYAFIDTGTIGTDAIKVGLIYKPAVVAPVGPYTILDSSVDPRFIDTRSRPSLAQTFELNANGERLTVDVNHLKSKGSACLGAPLNDPDTGDGQGNCNLTRTRAAEALVDWLATDPTGSGDPDVIVIGDLNAYAKEDPIEVFEDASYTNTIASFIGVGAYSFVFQGQSGYLDHALAGDTLAPQVNDVAEWHINADEPVVLDYNTDFKSANHVTTLYAPTPYRSSDHDPVVVGIDLGRCLFSDNSLTKTRTLLGDCSTSETILVPDGWTLDGDGHTISAYDPEGDHFRGAVVANAGTSAHVTDVTITTYHLADVCDAGDDRLRGILLDGAAGSITNNRVVDLNQGLSGCQEGNAIEVRNAPFDTTGTDLAVTVSGNEATGYQKTGILANGSVLATILDNEVVGWGPTGVIAQNGVQIGFGGSATIRGNSVSGNFYTGPDVACGLLFFQADGVRQSANTMFANERDLCNFGRGGGNVKPER